MKKDKIEAIIKEPGKAMYKKRINNTLEEFQELVAGYIEAVPVSEDVLMIVNEEGKLLRLPQSFGFGWDVICGTAVFVGRDGEVFSDCPVGIGDLLLAIPDLLKDEAHHE